MSTLSVILSTHSIDTLAQELGIPAPLRAPPKPSEVSEEAFSHVLAVGTYARHASRVAFILRILQAAIPVCGDGMSPQDGDTICVEGVTLTRYQAVIGAALLDLDHAGIGGDGGVGREAGTFASARIPILRCLPRHQHRTGAVWDAAVMGALSALQGALGDVYEVVAGLQIRAPGGIATYTPPATIVAVCAPWFRAQAIRALRAAGSAANIGTSEWIDAVRSWGADLDALELRNDTLAQLLSRAMAPGESIGDWYVTDAWVVKGTLAWDRSILEEWSRPRWTLRDGSWWNYYGDDRRALGIDGIPGERIPLSVQVPKIPDNAIPIAVARNSDQGDDAEKDACDSARW